MVEQDNTHEPSPEQTIPRPPKDKADQQGQAKTNADPEGQVIAVLPSHPVIGLQVGNILEVTARARLVENPTHVSPEDPLLNAVGISVLIYKAMVQAVVGGPDQRGVLYGCSSEQEEEHLHGWVTLVAP